MTIVASWVDKNEGVLWTISDSRLSDPPLTSGGDYRPKFDCGAKLFSLRINCFKPSKGGVFFNEIFFSTTIGLAFAGSSLIALNLYAFLSHTLDNLARQDDTEKPSLEEIAIHAMAVFLQLVNNSIKTVSLAPPCEISIFGLCPKNNEYKLFHIVYIPIKQQIIPKEININEEGYIHLMGDHNKEEVLKLINEKRNSLSKQDGKWWKAPKDVIEHIINENLYKTIGGHLQLGITSTDGFKLYSLLRPVVPGKPEAKEIFQNVNLDSDPALYQVGNFIIANRGHCY